MANVFENDKIKPGAYVWVEGKERMQRIVSAEFIYSEDKTQVLLESGEYVNLIETDLVKVGDLVVFTFQETEDQDMKIYITSFEDGGAVALSDAKITGRAYYDSLKKGAAEPEKKRRNVFGFILNVLKQVPAILNALTGSGLIKKKN